MSLKLICFAKKLFENKVDGVAEDDQGQAGDLAHDDLDNKATRCPTIFLVPPNHTEAATPVSANQEAVTAAAVGQETNLNEANCDTTSQGHDANRSGNYLETNNAASFEDIRDNASQIAFDSLADGPVDTLDLRPIESESGKFESSSESKPCDSLSGSRVRSIEGRYSAEEPREQVARTADSEQPITDDTTAAFCSIDAEISAGESPSQILSQLEREAEERLKKVSEMKTKAQILAAKRCLWTNVGVGLIFAAALSLMWTFSSTKMGAFPAAVVMNTVKVLMPILTTMANFGTIQGVASRYLEAAQESWIHLRSRLRSACCRNSQE